MIMALLWGQGSSRPLPPFQEPPSFCWGPFLAAHPCPPLLVAGRNRQSRAGCRKGLG